MKHFHSSRGWLRSTDCPDTGCKLNVHKAFRRRPGRLLNVLCTFSLRPVSRVDLWAKGPARFLNLSCVQGVESSLIKDFKLSKLEYNSLCQKVNFSVVHPIHITIPRFSRTLLSFQIQ